MGIDEKDSDKLTNNQELIDQEVESMQSILNQTEFQVVEDIPSVIAAKNSDLSSKLKKVVKLSLIPNCTKKFLLIDGAKDLSVELRCLPAMELTVCFPE